MTRPFGARRATCALLTLCGLVFSPALAAGQSGAQSAAMPAIRARSSGQADPPAHISLVEGSAVLERDGRADNSPGQHAAARRRSPAHADRPRRGPVRRRQHAAPRRQYHGRLPVGRARPAARRPGAADHRRARRARCRYRIDAPSAWVQITQPGEYRVALLRGDATRRSNSPSCAARPSSSTSSGRTPRPRRRARVRPRRAPRRRTRTSSTPRRGTRSIAGRKARRDQRLGVSAQYLPTDVRPYAPSFDRYGDWRYEPSYGYVWYPRVPTDWRPYYHGRWASAPAVRLDVDRRRSLGLADASLRPLGILRRACGSGFPAAAGRRRGSRGPMRRAT